MHKNVSSPPLTELSRTRSFYLLFYTFLRTLFQVGVSRAVSVLRPILNAEYIENLDNVGVNPGHLKNLDIVNQMAHKRKCSFIRALKGITRNKNLGINISRKLLPRKLKGSKKLRSGQKIRNLNMTESKPKSTTSSGAGSKVPVFAWTN